MKVLNEVKKGGASLPNSEGSHLNLLEHRVVGQYLNTHNFIFILFLFSLKILYINPT